MAGSKINKSPRRVVHCMATCRDCAWVADGYLDAARKASAHARQHNHEIGVEQGVTYTLRPAKR